MPHTKQDPGVCDPEEATGLRLIELLADGDPIPDTSAICLDRQRLIALLVEIGNGERSTLWFHIAQTAQLRGLSTQEIVSRAGFLLACLDIPGDDDPYTILGVSPAAAPEEIREAWRKRLSLCHPDRHREHAEWFNKQAARLNEAYQVLKDPVRRDAYNEQRRRALLRQEHNDPFVPQPLSSAPPCTPSLVSRLTGGRWPVLMTTALAGTAGLVLAALSAHHVEGPQLYLRPDQPTAAVTSAVPINDPLSAGPNQGEPLDRDLSVSRPWGRRSRTSHLKHVSHVLLPSDPSANRSVSSDKAAASKPLEQKPMLLAQALPPLLPEPKALERQEIDALLDEYIDAYEKADIERVMATLSTRVREKGTLDYQAIRNAYVKGFVGRDQIIYRLKNVQVEIKGEQATVTAQYLISARNAAQSAKATTVSGRIEWKLQREGDKLKIVAINY